MDCVAVASRTFTCCFQKDRKSIKINVRFLKKERKKKEKKKVIACTVLKLTQRKIVNLTREPRLNVAVPVSWDFNGKLTLAWVIYKVIKINSALNIVFIVVIIPSLKELDVHWSDTNFVFTETDSAYTMPVMPEKQLLTDKWINFRSSVCVCVAGGYFSTSFSGCAMGRKVVTVGSTTELSMTLSIIYTLLEAVATPWLYC